MRLHLACLCALSLPLVGAPVHTSLRAQVAQQEAQRLGLQTAWRTQVQLPRSDSGVVSSHLWVETAQPRSFAVVELSDRTIRVSADTLDRQGQPIGLEEAKVQAGQQAARVLGKSEGIQVVEVNVPRVKLVLVTGDGLVQTLDAESGELLWATTCGPSHKPAHPAAVSAAGVTVIHGDMLYVLDWENGRHRMEIPLRYASSNAVAVCENVAFVFDFLGRVDTYGLAEAQRPWGYRIRGRVVGQPVSLRGKPYCAVASADGYVYVFSVGEKPSAWVRYETDSGINGSLSSGNNAFYAGTAAGLLTKFSVENRLGQLEWEFRSGETLTQPPLVVGDRVIVTSESGEVFALSDSNGELLWESAGLGLFAPLARAGGTIFCSSLVGEVFALNADTGRVLAKTSPLNLSRPIMNQVDDRLYLLSRSGQLQCLRPPSAVLPTMIQPVNITTDEEKSAEETAEPVEEATSGGDPFGSGAAPAATNPFGAGDPFGGAASPPATGSNPFGGAAPSNPFGGGAAADPFGGSGNADPFGNPSAADPFGTGTP